MLLDILEGLVDDGEDLGVALPLDHFKLFLADDLLELGVGDLIFIFLYMLVGSLPHDLVISVGKFKLGRVL